MKTYTTDPKTTTKLTPQEVIPEKKHRRPKDHKTCLCPLNTSNTDLHKCKMFQVYALNTGSYDHPSFIKAVSRKSRKSCLDRQKV
jgi:hypothetical protein